MKLRERTISTSILLLTLLVGLQAELLAQFAGGSGTEGDPYQISTPVQLDSVRNHLSSHFILINDIDLDVSPYNSGYGWVPIGFLFSGSHGSFSGTFDGGDYAVMNLTSEINGLFWDINSLGSVSNILLGNLEVVRSITGVGGLAASNHGTLTHVYVEGDISGLSEVGALVGRNYSSGVISESGVLDGSVYIMENIGGGLVGRNDGTISNSYVAGGGNIAIFNSQLNANTMGGIAGFNTGTISNSFNEKIVAGAQNLGGIAGSNSGTIQLSISFAGIVDFTQIGRTGFVAGINSGTIEDTYWVNYGNEFSITGQESGTLTNNTAIGYGSEVRDQSNYTNLNFSTIWTSYNGVSGPFLQNSKIRSVPLFENPFAGGEGDEYSPFQVSTPTELDSVRNYLEDHFIQTADIDLDTSPYNSGSGWDPIATNGTEFEGFYDGQEYSINNLFINRSGTDFVGLFGSISTGEVINIALNDVDITGRNYVGALIGLNYSDIKKSYASGSVTGENNVGGLVGLNEDYSSTTGDIFNSYSTVNVTASGAHVGGLAGRLLNGAEIHASYSSGTVIGNSYVGGLVGRSDGSVFNSFWNIESSGRSTSSEGTGLTNTQMKTETTFSSASWDFTDIWSIAEGTSYPYLTNNTPENLPGVPLTYSFGGGMGTDQDPYQITSVMDLDSVRNYLDAYFILTTDLDLNVVPYNTGSGWEPIGNNSDPFTGNFDGDGHTINNLFIDRSSTDYVGLFGRLSGATVENLGVEGVDVTGADYSGGLSGANFPSNTITNSYVTGVIKGDTYTGGIAGLNNSSSISKSYFIGELDSDESYTGGITGYHNNGGSISESYSEGEITGDSYTGGLVGLIFGATLTNSYSISDITGNYRAGGLVGANHLNSSTVSNSFSTGTVTGNTDVGGFVGNNDDASISQSYWNTSNSELLTGIGNDNNSQSVTGLTPNEMRQEESFANWDFSSIWTIREDTTYPYLKFLEPDSIPGFKIPLPPPFAVGEGTIEEPFQISTPVELDSIRNYLNATFILVNDINLDVAPYNTGSGWEPIGADISSSFKGEFDGQNYTISNLFINRDDTDYIGLFGYISDTDVLIENLNLDDVNITGEDYTGAFTGYASGVSYSNLTASGTVNGNEYVGGLVGFTYNSPVRNSSSTQSVIGEHDFIGGLIGDAFSGVFDSYSDGNVEGDSRVGGITGRNADSLSQTYSKSTVTGTGSFIGGLSGYSQGTINKSFAAGNVIGGSYVGGATGNSQYSSESSPGLIIDSYSVADVSGDQLVGGLIGRLTNGTIVNTYSGSKVTGTTTNGVGGLLGATFGTVTIEDSYWSSEISGYSTSIGTGDSSGITKLDVQQMTNSSNYTNWDFNSDSVWGIELNSTLPYLVNVGTQITKVAAFDGSGGWRTVGNLGDLSYDEFLDRIWTQGYTGSDGGTGGFSSNVFYFDEGSYNWKSPTDSSNYFGTNNNVKSDSLRGVLVWFYGDDNNDGNENSWPKYLIAKSFIRNMDSTYTVPLSYSHFESPDSSGWHLISNPYPRSLNWEDIIDAEDNQNTLPIAYIWDHSLNANNGGYKINFGYPLPPGAPEDFFFDGHIPVMQSFWVKATDENASITFRPEHQESAVNPYKINSNESEKPTSWVELRIVSGDFADQVLLFGENNEVEIPKLETIANRYVELELLDTDKLAWHGLPLNMVNEKELYLNLNSTETGDFEIKTDFQNISDEHVQLTLIDNLSGKSINISETEKFSFHLDETQLSTLDSRFKLRISVNTQISAEDQDNIPKHFVLDQNYPNPFNPSTMIRYGIPEYGKVNLEIFDLMGRKVSTLIKGQVQQAGYHQVIFNASGLASGMYIYRLQAGNQVFTKKLTLIK